MQKFTVIDTLQHKQSNEKITMVTAYDYTFAKIIDKTKKIDMILVGDSLGMTIQGHSTTIPVTLEHSIYHTEMVSRAVRNAMVIGDMPFMSYQISVEQAVESAGRLVQEGGAEAIKLEGAGNNLEKIQRIIEAGIPVQGHLGLTPQSVHKLGGWRVQGRSRSAVDQLLADAKALQEAGIFSLVLESIPNDAAKLVSESLDIPTIGIGAGPHCDGQVLVIHDLVGLSDFSAVFVKRYADVANTIANAVTAYADEVRSSAFPGEEFAYKTQISDD